MPACAMCGKPCKKLKRKFCSPACAGNTNKNGQSEARRQVVEARVAQRRAKFLAALKKIGTIRLAAQSARIDFSTIYKWRRDPDFAAKMDEARDYVADLVEGSLIQRAVHGVPKPIFYKGQQVGTEYEFDTPGAMFWLRGRRPEVFGDRVVQTMQNPDGSAIALTPSMTAVQLVLDDATAAEVRASMQQRALPAPARAAPAVEVEVEAKRREKPRGAAHRAVAG
jgi:hypothetical protein